MDFPGVPFPAERIVYSLLPVQFVLPGIPEATNVLCGGGMALRALAIGVAVFAGVFVLRALYRLLADGSLMGVGLSLLSATLPVVVFLWLSTQTTIEICFSSPLIRAIG